jgi:hypothetical protein
MVTVVGYFYWAWRMVKGRKPGVNLFDQKVGWNPFNICFRPSLLTEEGLRARRWFLTFAFGLPIIILLLLHFFFSQVR